MGMGKIEAGSGRAGGDSTTELTMGAGHEALTIGLVWPETAGADERTVATDGGAVRGGG